MAIREDSGIAAKPVPKASGNTLDAAAGAISAKALDQIRAQRAALIQLEDKSAVPREVITAAARAATENIG